MIVTRPSSAGAWALALSAACAVSLLIVLTSGVPTAHAAFPGLNGKIAFDSTRDGSRQVYTMNPDGSAQTRLTDQFDRTSSMARFSADGERLTFIGRVHGDDLIGTVFTVNAAGSDLTNVNPGNSWRESSPAFSPDGERIAFTNGARPPAKIYVMNVDGSDSTRVPDHAWPHPDRPFYNPVHHNPSFSPDGQKIVFESSHAIWIMNADGSDITLLTNLNPDTPPWNEGGWNRRPSFSPDGERIAFMTGRDGNSEIYLMDADGSNKINLTNHPSADESPVFSPDGERIAFASNRDGNHAIYIMEADGSNPTRITHNPAGESPTDWGPLPSSPSPPPNSGPLPSLPSPPLPNASGPLPSSPSPAELTLPIQGKRLAMNRRGVTRARLRCVSAEAGPCTGRLALRTQRRVRFQGERRRVVLTAARYRVPQGTATRVRLRLGPQQRSLVHKQRPARRIRAIARVRDGAGNQARVSKKMRLAPRRASNPSAQSR